jgi:hypothetical protein
MDLLMKRRPPLRAVSGTFFVFGVLGWAAAALIPGGCYAPQKPPCAFSCEVDGLCPQDYSCGTDGLCHRAGAAGVCNLTPPLDSGVDSGADTGIDGGLDGGLDGADAF